MTRMRERNRCPRRAGPRRTAATRPPCRFWLPEVRETSSPPRRPTASAARAVLGHCRSAAPIANRSSLWAATVGPWESLFNRLPLTHSRSGQQRLRDTSIKYQSITKCTCLHVKTTARSQPLRRCPTSTTAPSKTSRRVGHWTELNIQLQVALDACCCSACFKFAVHA